MRRLKTSKRVGSLLRLSISEKLSGEAIYANFVGVLGGMSSTEELKSKGGAKGVVSGQVASA